MILTEWKTGFKPFLRLLKSFGMYRDTHPELYTKYDLIAIDIFVLQYSKQV